MRFPARERLTNRGVGLRQNAWDAANGVAATGFVASFLAGVDWPAIAAFCAAAYSLILIAEKLYSFYKRWRAQHPA